MPARYSRSLYLGKQPDGKEIRKRVYANTKKELEAECVRVRAEWEIINGSVPTLSTYAHKWYNETKQAAEINTQAMYENLLKHIDLSDISQKKIRDITLSDLQQLINEHNSTPNICKKLKMCLGSIFEYAVKNDIIQRNPTDGIVTPKGQSVPRYTFSNSQIRALEQANLNDLDKAYAFTLFFFGLRPGEALGLQQKDFDFKNKTLTVERSVAFDRDGNTPYIKTTKTDNIRKLPITSTAEDFLYDYVTQRPSGYIFTMRNGGLISKSSNTKRWRRIVTAWNAELPPEDKLEEDVKPYCFRYTYATRLYYSGITIKKAAELMGHTSTKMILEIYAQLDNAKEDLNALENSFRF